MKCKHCGIELTNENSIDIEDEECDNCRHVHSCDECEQEEGSEECEDCPYSPKITLVLKDTEKEENL